MILIASSTFALAEPSLLDVEITIPEHYKKITPEDTLLASISLANLASPGRIDVAIDYWINDPEQNTILKKKETVAVETQANFVKFFDMPKGVMPGDYSLYAKLSAGDKEAFASHSFEIVKNQDNKAYYGIFGLFVLMLVILAFPWTKGMFSKMYIKTKVRKIVKRKALS